MQLNILGKIVEFSEKETKYFELRKSFIALADEKSREFSQTFSKKYDSLERLIEKGFQDGVAQILPAVEIGIKTFVDYDIYEFDEEELAKRIFQKYSFFEDAFTEINDSYQKIVLSQEELDNYRVRRRESRGQWIGGGFGVGGAVKGALQAGAMNLAAGAVHMVFNGVGKVFSAIGSSIEKTLVFDKEKSEQSLAKAIWRMIYNSHFLIIELLNTAKDDEIIEALYTPEREKKASTILKNIKKYPPKDKEALKDKYREILKTCPYVKELFEELLENFQDPTGDLQVLGDNLGIDVLSLKEKIVKTYIKEINWSDSEKLSQSLKGFEVLVRDFGISGQEEILSSGLGGLGLRDLEIAKEALVAFGDVFVKLKTKIEALYEEKKEALKKAEKEKIKSEETLEAKAWEEKKELAKIYKWELENESRFYGLILVAIIFCALPFYNAIGGAGVLTFFFLSFFTIAPSFLLAYSRGRAARKLALEELTEKKILIEKLQTSNFNNNFSSITVIFALFPILNVFIGWPCLFRKNSSENFRVFICVWLIINAFFTASELGKDQDRRLAKKAEVTDKKLSANVSTKKSEENTKRSKEFLLDVVSFPIGRVKAQSGLSIRSEPNVSSKKLGHLDNNQIIPILDLKGPEARIENQEGRWVMVLIKGEFGWCFSGFLELDWVERKITAEEKKHFKDFEQFLTKFSSDKNFQRQHISDPIIYRSFDGVNGVDVEQKVSRADFEPDFALDDEYVRNKIQFIGPKTLKIIQSGIGTELNIEWIFEATDSSFVLAAYEDMAI